MPTMGREVGSPTHQKCCWACCSMAMPPECLVRARLSVPPMKACHFASSQAICILTTIRSPWIAQTFLQELKDLFVQVLLLAQEAGVLKLGTISLDGTKVHADARHSQSGELQTPAGVGDPVASRGRRALCQKPAER